MLSEWSGLAHGLANLEIAGQGRGTTPSTESITAGNGEGANTPASSPLYLMAAEIVDLVEMKGRSK